MNQYDPGANGYSGAIPFIDLGNKYVEVGNISPLRSYRHRRQELGQVAAAMTQPCSRSRRPCSATANYMTAGICKLTNNQPASACTPTIQTAGEQARELAPDRPRRGYRL